MIDNKISSIWPIFEVINKGQFESGSPEGRLIGIPEIVPIKADDSGIQARSLLCNNTRLIGPRKVPRQRETGNPFALATHYEFGRGCAHYQDLLETLTKARRNR